MGELAAAEPTGTLQRVPVAWIHPGDNARADLGDITGLAASIRALGLQKPLIVHPAHGLGAGGYIVLDGHRRLAALRSLGHTHAEVIIRPRPHNAGRVLRQLAIHTHAAPIDPIAEAQAIHALMWPDDPQKAMSRDQIAHLLGRSQQWVADRLGLLQLGDADQRAVAAGRMGLAQAKLVVGQLRAARDGRQPYTSTTPATTRPAAAELATRRSPVALSPRHCRTCTCTCGSEP